MAEKKVIEIEIQDNSKTLKQQYKEAVLEVQKLADAFGATSIEVQNASKKAAELKDQIEDVNDAIQSQKGEGAFIALGKSVSAVANGFSAVQGAMGLVGVESEEVQQAMLRVQSAMALAQGLEGLEDAGRAFSQLKTIVTSFGTTAVNAFKAMSTASKAFLVTGIGLLIAGLGTAIAYWDDISKAIGLTSDEQEKYAQKQKIINEQSKKQAEATKKESKELASMQSAYALQIGMLSKTNAGSKERLKLINDINKEYGTSLKNIKDEAKFQDQLSDSLEKYLLLKRVEYQVRKNEAYFESLMAKESDARKVIQKEKIKISEEDIKNILKVQDTKERAYKMEQILLAKNPNRNLSQMAPEVKALIDLRDEQGRVSEATFNLQNVKSSLIATTFTGNNQTKDEVETNKDLAKTLEELTQKNAQFGLSERELLDLNKLKTDALIQEQFLKSTDKDKEKQRTDALLANETDYNNQVNALNEKNRKTRIELEDKQFEVMQSIGQTEKEKEIADLVKSYEDKFAIVGDNNVLEQELTEQQKKDLAVIEEKYRKTQAEKDKEAADKNIALQRSKLQMTADAFGAIGGLIESFNAKDEASARKQFKIAKAFNLAAAITNTYLGITDALAKDGTFPGSRFIAAGTVATTGLASIVKIASTQFGSGGGGGNNPVPTGGGGVIAPNLNVVGDTGINQLATLQQQPIKAYVVSNDITSAQQFDLKVQQTASL